MADVTNFGTDEDSSTPPELKPTVSPSLPLSEKSIHLYEKSYVTFSNWCKERNVDVYSEGVLLAYFTEKSKTVKSSTLWSTYSMLKATILIKNNYDISKYKKLTAFLKKENAEYVPKQSSVFNREDLIKFLTKAPNKKYLMWKVCLTIGLSGACRIDELKKLCISDVQDKDDVLIVAIGESKNGKKRRFMITNEVIPSINAIDLYREYRALRPPNTPHDSLFVFYKDGKCSPQPVGIHTIGKIPYNIAKYLNLDNAVSYTGHAFRRTSASLLTDTGADLLTLKKHGEQKSNNVTEVYIKQDIDNSDITEISQPNSSNLDTDIFNTPTTTLEESENAANPTTNIQNTSDVQVFCQYVKGALMDLSSQDRYSAMDDIIAVFKNYNKNSFVKM